ncbi:MAG TPA: hypothetical protein PK297_08195 [Spirochaetota bacterium]|nr:hypothetical protein [Spirochaetota bacterium]
MVRVSAASSGMRLVCMLALFFFSMLALLGGFIGGVLLSSGTWHEGDMAALVEERGIGSLFTLNDPDLAVFHLAAERLLAQSPVLAVDVLSRDAILYSKAIQSNAGERALPANSALIRQMGRIICHDGRLLYACQPSFAREILVVLEVTQEDRPWRATLSRAIARVGEWPGWGIPVIIAGWSLLSLTLAWCIVWMLYSRPVSRVVAVLEACEQVEDLATAKLFGGTVSDPLVGCIERLVQRAGGGKKTGFESLLPRRRGYDFPGFDAATVYAGTSEKLAVHVDIRPLGDGRYGIMLLAVKAEDESEEALVRIATVCDACFSLYVNPAQVASSLNRYMHSMSIPFPVDAGFLVWSPSEKKLEFCLNGSVNLFRYDVREGTLRGYDLKQPVLEGGLPEEFDAGIGFARLDIGEGDPVVLAYAPGVEWESLVTDVLKKSTTLAERQQTLNALLGQRLGPGDAAAVLMMSLSE